jgi:hypothetical protein
MGEAGAPNLQIRVRRSVRGMVLRRFMVGLLLVGLLVAGMHAVQCNAQIQAPGLIVFSECLRAQG